jgi:two-component system, chemotaxis family, response regulator PixG
VFLTEPNTPLKQQLVFLDTHKLVMDVQKQSLSWQKAKVADRLPNQAPGIKYLDRLRQQTSPASYEALVRLLNGSYTLRAIAFNRKRDIVDIITLLLPYIQSGVVELHDIHDLPIPIPNLPQAIAKPLDINPLDPDINIPLIACIDDSPAVCQAMEKILTAAKFRFVAIQNPLRAISTLLTVNPDLIESPPASEIRPRLLPFLRGFLAGNNNQTNNQMVVLDSDSIFAAMPQQESEA